MVSKYERLFKGKEIYINTIVIVITPSELFS